MDIQGLNFGPVPAPLTDRNANVWPTPIVYYGPEGETGRYTASACSVIVDDKVIRCFTVPGTGAGYWLRLVLAGQSFTKEANISYAMPIVSNYKGDGADEASTLGGERITIVGDNFGTIVASAVSSVTYGRAGTEFIGRQCNVTKDQTEISCYTSPGAGTSLKWIVTIDGQQSTTPTTNYKRPLVTNIFSNPSGDGVTTGTPDSFGPDGEELVFGKEMTAGSSPYLTHILLPLPSLDFTLYSLLHIPPNPPNPTDTSSSPGPTLGPRPRPSSKRSPTGRQGPSTLQRSAKS